MKINRKFRKLCRARYGRAHSWTKGAWRCDGPCNSWHPADHEYWNIMREEGWYKAVLPIYELV